jgi:Lanthionine-containing peptide SapB precursor RamS
MALLDLQGMEEPEDSRGLGAKSAASKGCSHFSLILC